MGDDKGVATSDHEFEAPATFAADGTEADGTNKWVVTTGMITSTEALGDLIWLGDLKIAWRLEYRDMQATPVAQTTYGESKNRLYVAGGVAPEEFETVLYLGCSGAYGKRPSNFGESLEPAEDANGNGTLDAGEDVNGNGVPDPAGSGWVHNDEVVDAIWTKFSTGTGPASPKRVDGATLTYYGYRVDNANGTYDAGVDQNFNTTDSCVYTTTAELLKQQNGQCFSWANLLHDVLKAQGVASLYVQIAAKQRAIPVNLAINNWSRNGAQGPWLIVSEDAGVTGTDTVAVAAGQAADRAGTPGQGLSSNPQSIFGQHFVVFAQGKLFDPSYGVGKFRDFADYEAVAFAGTVTATGNDKYLSSAPVSDHDPMTTTDLIATYAGFSD